MGNEILVLSIHSSRADYLHYQFRSIKKFFQFNHRIVVLNDTDRLPDNCVLVNEVDKVIREECNRLGIEFVKTGLVDKLPAAEQHGQAINLMIREFAFRHDGLVIILDSDMFPLRPFDFYEFMDGFSIAAIKGFAGGKVKSETVFYCHPCLVMMDVPKLPDKEQVDFSPGVIDGLCADTGAQMYYYFMNHPELPVKWLHLISERDMKDRGFCDVKSMQERRVSICNIETDYKNGYFCGDLIEGGFYHVRNASNWHQFPMEWHKENSMIIQKYMKNQGIISDSEAKIIPHIL